MAGRDNGRATPAGALATKPNCSPTRIAFIIEGPGRTTNQAPVGGVSDADIDMQFRPLHQLSCNRRRSRLPQRAIIALAIVSWGATASKAEPTVEVIRDRVYLERDSGPLAMDLYVPHGAGPFPGMLVIHGGAWHMGSRAQFATVAMALAKHGYTAASVSYRLAPQHKFPAQVYDCQAAVRWLRQHASEFKIDPTRIGGYGYSAGGQLVALLGTLDDDDFREAGVPADAPSARLQAVLAGAAPCDFRMLVPHSNRLAYWLGGTPAVKPDAYRDASPAHFVTPDDPPMFFFHGQRDSLVPIRSPQRMIERLVAAGVTAEMYTLPTAGHITPVFDTLALQQAIKFADRHLKSSLANRSTAASRAVGAAGLAAGPGPESRASRAVPGPDSSPSANRLPTTSSPHGQ